LLCGVPALLSTHLGLVLTLYFAPSLNLLKGCESEASLFGVNPLWIDLQVEPETV